MSEAEKQGWLIYLIITVFVFVLIFVRRVYKYMTLNAAIEDSIKEANEGSTLEAVSPSASANDKPADAAAHGRVKRPIGALLFWLGLFLAGTFALISFQKEKPPTPEARATPSAAAGRAVKKEFWEDSPIVYEMDERGRFIDGPQTTETRPLTYRGMECTSDCSGHEAGYEWAEENDISDPDDCSGNSDSFVEGCQAWAEENQE
jgi:hypothetical protein